MVVFKPGRQNRQFTYTIIRMRVLHISNDYAGSKVHCNLTSALDELGLEQLVYCPVRNASLIGGNIFEGEHTRFVYSNCIKPWYRFAYYYKERRLYKDLKCKIDLSTVNCIHAHTLFSDGGLAYKAHKEYGVKYVVAIRNTDVNLFMKYMKHTFPFGRKILLNAEKIYFISKALEQKFVESSLCNPIYEIIKNKMIVQPNGIDSYWLEHIKNEPRWGHDVLYIGDFTPNKNVERLINAVSIVRSDSRFNDCRLIIIGGGRDKNQRVEEKIEKNKYFVVFKGKIFDKAEISKIMKSCAVFAMPSITETFGLVYIESLSQNLPVIYTKGQGIDGIFDNSVGLSVDPYSTSSIAEAIKEILDNHVAYSNRIVDFSDFDWRLIAQKYKGIYTDICNG